MDYISITQFKIEIQVSITLAYNIDLDLDHKLTTCQTHPSYSNRKTQL